ncbi:MAG: hypothetical protein A3A44_02905 [Candidatus Sungbacteria bacterium RIFCSPLOWO2_01_FULL_60_25]|uniref:DUF5666 domain-containing protein n=1 Tax=Candidatus Sungbacteria bacterium RIFCSPLOWO2_01_FULL_60_25 TaxID=1802281 RepID=A0A1G2LCN6_9BACT|nr:MAG: hypothetical protein A3A44_02905 [Candidatus Sungbacteria bacterium RIFCSPLOWO2_01_FULL_60_25]
MFTQRNIFYGSLGALMFTGLLVAGALAQTPPDMRGVPPLLINIDSLGRVLVRGAIVTAAASSSAPNTLTATTNLNSMNFTWIVQTDGSTEFIRQQGSHGNIAEIAVGHIISFEGTLVAGSQLTVKARVVRDWSVRKVESNQFGQVLSVNSAVKSFVLKADERERGNITVFTSDATKFMKGEKATTTFAALKAGDLVQIHGVWDRNANTIQASLVKIRTEPRRVFEGGILKTTSISAPPTSIVVTFGRFDYTVNIDTDTAVLNQNWAPVPLASFRVGDQIRVYGAADGTIIDASVVRDMNLR